MIISLVNSVGASFGHRLGKILPTLVYCLQYRNLEPFLVDIYWSPIGSVGDLKFEQLFSIKLPNVKIHSIKYEESVLPNNLLGIRAQNTERLEVENNRLKTNYIFVDGHPKIDQFAHGCLKTIFTLSPLLQGRYEQYARAFKLEHIVGFQIRCREDRNTIIDRDSISSLREVADRYLEQVKNKAFFFCTDSGFVQQYIQQQRPDGFFIPKAFEAQEKTSSFVKRDKQHCEIAAIEFFCLVNCKTILQWPIGGWTQYACFFNPNV